MAAGCRRRSSGRACGRMCPPPPCAWPRISALQRRQPRSGRRGVSSRAGRSRCARLPPHARIRGRRLGTEATVRPGCARRSRPVGPKCPCAHRARQPSEGYRRAGPPSSPSSGRSHDRSPRRPSALRRGHPGRAPCLRDGRRSRSRCGARRRRCTVPRRSPLQRALIPRCRARRRASTRRRAPRRRCTGCCRRPPLRRRHRLSTVLRLRPRRVSGNRISPGGDDFEGNLIFARRMARL